MKKRLGIVVLAILTGITVIYAGFSDVHTITNHIVSGDVNIAIREYEMLGKKEIAYKNPKTIVPGDEISKIPRIINYAKPCWLRVRIGFGSSGSSGGLTIDNLQGMPDGWIRKGEYFYYTEPLERGDSVDVFKKVVIPADWDSGHALQELSVTVHADAVQAANFSPDFTSLSPWGDQEIELCVHEENSRVTCSRKNTALSLVFHGEVYQLMSVPDDFFANFGSIMPGDVLKDTVSVENTTDRQAEIFFSTGLEKQTDEQLEFLEKLQLSISMNGKRIYTGNLKADALKEKISLGSFEPGQKGSLSFALYMPENLDNAYALRDAEVKWIFSVNGDDPEENEISSNGQSAGTKERGTASAPVKTGDESKAFRYLFLIISAGVLAVCLIVCKKGGKKDER